MWIQFLTRPKLFPLSAFTTSSLILGRSHI